MPPRAMIRKVSAPPCAGGGVRVPLSHVALPIYGGDCALLSHSPHALPGLTSAQWHCVDAFASACASVLGGILMCTDRRQPCYDGCTARRAVADDLREKAASGRVPALSCPHPTPSNLRRSALSCASARDAALMNLRGGCPARGGLRDVARDGGDARGPQGAVDARLGQPAAQGATLGLGVDCLFC